jgi:transposase
MVIVGIDAHKRTHTAVVIDEAGRKLGERRTTSTTTEANLELLRWADGFGTARRFAVEDCRHLSRRLEADLLAAGEALVRVPPKMMAHARDAARTYGKSDPIDALAVAQAGLREPDLPVAHLDGPTRKVKLLADYRADLVVERTMLCNRLRWHLHELDPELEVPSRGLRRYKVIDQLAAHLAGVDGTVAQIARELLGRCRELTVRINQLERDLRDLVRVLAPGLVAIPGCGVLAAATILGETAGATRFRSRHAFARFNGTAPIPVWSGNSVRVRLNRGGNRTVNWALHMIAVTQARGVGPGAAYVERLLAGGKTRTEALRLLRRRLSDVVYRVLLADEHRQAEPVLASAPQAA